MVSAAWSEFIKHFKTDNKKTDGLVMTSTELLCYYMYFESNAHDKGLLFTYIAHRWKQMAHLSRVPNTRFYNMVTFPIPSCSVKI